jgi:hypothetical protein
VAPLVCAESSHLSAIAFVVSTAFERTIEMATERASAL